MDEDYGSELADAQANDEYHKERGTCSLCGHKYDDDGNCWCDDEDNY